MLRLAWLSDKRSLVGWLWPWLATLAISARLAFVVTRPSAAHMQAGQRLSRLSQRPGATGRATGS
jgi:hypothetical protein